MATRREREQRQRRYANAKEIAERDMSGSERDTLTLPKGINVFDFKKEGTYRLDVLPYEVGEGNPKADTGMFHYERRYYVHKRVGPNKESYVCLGKTYKKRCPICEYLSKGEVSEDEYKDLKAKERQLIAIVDLDDKTKGVQIYEGPFYFGLGELISQDLELAETDDPIVDFYHPDKGLSLKVLIKHEAIGKGKFFKPVKITFMPRKSGYDDAFLDTVPCLDELIKRPSVEDLQTVLEGLTGSAEEETPIHQPPPSRGAQRNGVHEEEEEEEAPPRRARRAPEPEEEEASPLKVGSDVSHEDFGDCTIVKIHASGALDLEDEDGDVHKKIPATEVSPVGAEDPDEEDEAPPKRTARAPVDENEDEDEDGDGDDDEDEEELAAKKRSKSRR